MQLDQSKHIDALCVCVPLTKDAGNNYDYYGL